MFTNFLKHVYQSDYKSESHFSTFSILETTSKNIEAKKINK